MRIIKKSDITFPATRLTDKQLNSLLEPLGIEIVKRINSGLWSDVFETIFSGKRVILKVTKSARDYKNYLVMDEIKKSLPTEYEKFLPITYFFKKLDSDYGEIFLIGVEPLLPLDPNVRKNMFELSSTHHNYFKYDINELAVKFLKAPLIRRIDSPEDVRNYFDDNIKNNPDVAKEIIENFIKNKKLVDSDLSEEDDEYLNNSLNGMLNMIFAKESTKNIVSRSVDQMQENDDIIPESRDFIKFCKLLERKYKVKAQDIHPGNIMMRPNGDIVVSDTGSFIAKQAAAQKLEDKYYGFTDPDFEKADYLDRGIDGKVSRNRIAKEVFKKLNLPLIKEIASGVFSSAFESYWGGKPICVKITQEEGDYRNYETIKDMYSSFGKDKKYFPKVYKLHTLDNYYVIITELLVPIEPNVKANLFDSVETFVARNVTFKQCLNHAKEYLSRPGADILKGVPDKVSNIIIEHINDFAQMLFVSIKNKELMNPVLAKTQIEKWIKTLSPEDQLIIKSKDNPNSLLSNANYVKNAFIELFYTLERELSDLHEQPEFPLSKERKDFAEFLKRMIERNGMHLDDLHRNNVMMRPNGELVICDVTF